MTLYEVLVELKIKYLRGAIDTFVTDDTEYYKNIGRMDMCNKIFELLSDETLNVEIKTRSDMLIKGEGK